MQSLKITPRLLPDVHAGIKRHTIRWQEPTIIPGPMRYVNAENPSDTVVVQVIAVHRMPLHAVAGHLGMTDEWPDPVILSGMQEHYPDINLTSEVEVIHHLAPE